MTTIWLQKLPLCTLAAVVRSILVVNEGSSGKNTVLTLTFVSKSINSKMVRQHDKVQKQLTCRCDNLSNAIFWGLFISFSCYWCFCNADDCIWLCPTLRKPLVISTYHGRRNRLGNKCFYHSRPYLETKKQFLAGCDRSFKVINHQSGQVVKSILYYEISEARDKQ